MNSTPHTYSLGENSPLPQPSAPAPGDNVIELHNLIGGVGFVLLLGTYLLLQLNKLEAQSLIYSQLNAIGAALLLVSLAFDFNLSAVLVESSWLLISLIGIAVTLLEKKRSKTKDAT